MIPNRDPKTVREGELFEEDPEFPECWYLDDVLPRSPMRGAYERHGDCVFSHAYIRLLRECLKGGHRQLNARTGAEVRTLLHCRLSHECLFGAPLPGVRKVYPGTAAAEVAWSLMGTEDVSFMSRHASIWDKFAVDGKVPGAYGHRWRNAFGRDQLSAAFDTLSKDASSRQVYVSTWDAASDGLDADSKALAPCPVGFTMQSLDDRLNMVVHMRSSDLAVGLPYDTLFYSYLLAASAEELDLARGRLTMELDHAHVYEPQARVLDEAFNPAMPYDVGCAPMPRWSVSDIEADPDGFVREAKELARDVHQPPPMRFEAVAAEDDEPESAPSP